MLLLNKEVEAGGLMRAAELICLAARTAPKGRGLDLLVTAIITDEEKDKISRKMREIAQRDGIEFFGRDAGNVEGVDIMIVLGTRKEPLGIPSCGFCGFADCQGMLEEGGTCAFNAGDLGIALGSAVSRAADLRVDNRIMYSAGKASVELGILGEDVKIAYGIPLSVAGKNPFFDRK